VPLPQQSSSRTNRVFWGLVSNFAQYFIITALQFLLAPLILKYAGKETLGAYSVVMQIVAWGSLSDLGFGVSVARNLAQAHGLKDGHKKFREVFSTGKAFYIISNIVFAVFIWLFAFNINKFMEMQPYVAEQAKIALGMYGLWVAVRIAIAMYGYALVATQNMALKNISVTTGSILRLVLSLAFIINGFGLPGLVLANILAEICMECLDMWLYKRLYPADKFKFSIKNKSAFREMFIFGSHCMLLTIATKLMLSTDNIIVGNLYGASAVSVYYVTVMPGSVLYQLVRKISETSMPALNEVYAAGNRGKFTEAYFAIMRYSLILTIPLMLGLIIFNKHLIALWVGPEQYGGLALTVGLAFFAFSQVLNQLNSTILIATGDVSNMSRFALLSGLIKVFLAYAAGRYGLWVIMWSSVAVDMCFLAYFSRHILKILSATAEKVYSTVATPALKLSAAMSGMAAITAVVLPSKASWSSFFACAGLFCTVAVIAAWFLAITPDERSGIKGYVRKYV